ncbi:ABC transporter substrate-binding protein [Butyrivibrio sp. MC2013]|uniref:ABC transporter substrate-binding protein n=1 Tax=Butyrivibrio sp. MC2013 TaxID=1280686 RepID=UPI000417702B|nr:sugar ABC transporter substrate-binding protein [Butyrivibrio sp. MC2013]
MKKKLLSLLLVCATTTAMLAGCGSGEASAVKGESRSDDASDDGVITLYVTDWEDDTMNAAIQKACDEVFSVQHPNIKVKVLSGSYSDYGQQITAMIQAGDDLDIFQQGYDGANANFKKGMLYDWTEYVEKEPDFINGFYKGAMDGWQYDGKCYGLPGLANVYGIFYNKDLLAAKGLSEPATDWTWDDLFDMAEQLKDTSAGTYGLYSLNTDIFGITNLAVAEGGSQFVDDITNTQKVTVDDKMIEAAERISGLIADGTIPSRSYDGSDVQSMFESGAIPLMYYGQWEINSLLNNCPDLNWGYAPLPQGSVKATVPYDFVGWSAKKDLAHPEETWELLKFLSSDVYKDVLKVSPVAACAHEASAQVFFDTVREKGHGEAADAVTNMMERSDKCAVRYAAEWGSDASKLWDVAYNELIDGEGSGDFNVLKDLADQVNAVIAAAQ